MTTFRRLKKLVELKTIPEPSEGFWSAYLPDLRKKIELEPVPLFLRVRPIPLISLALTTLVGISIITTLNIYKPQVHIMEDLTDLEDLIAENFVSEDIIREFLPKDMLYPIIGGDYHEIL